MFLDYSLQYVTVNLCLLNCIRFLEHFILNGTDPNAVEAVLAQLNDPKRQNPQELDKAVIGENGFNWYLE